MSNTSALSGARPLRRALLALIFALALVALPSQSFAATSSCRGDPFIQLSNGMKIQLVIAANVDVTAVVDITYIVHVPAGAYATLIKLAQTSATLNLASREHVVVISDLPAKQYKINTTLTTLTPAVATVTAGFTPGPTLSASGSNGSKGISISYTAP